MSFKAVLQQLNADKKEYAKGVGTPLLVLAALGMVNFTVTAIFT